MNFFAVFWNPCLSRYSRIMAFISFYELVKFSNYRTGLISTSVCFCSLARSAGGFWGALLCANRLFLPTALGNWTYGDYCCYFCGGCSCCYYCCYCCTEPCSLGFFSIVLATKRDLPVVTLGIWTYGCYYCRTELCLRLLLTFRLGRGRIEERFL